MSDTFEGSTYNNIIESSGVTFSKLVGWEVWNFMSLEHAKVTFDDSNILNFKGYNNVGKSAMLRALDVALFNIKPNSQVGFIQDDKDYFRIMIYFDDDVIILRDKYINGQSLYEMYKGNQVIFTTKQNGHLTKVSDVPQPIADYLGLISYNGIILNSRSCFEKQLLVMTSGSENYGFLNSVLKSEELAIASEALNVDKNKLSGDIENLETQLSVYRDSYKESEGVTEELLSELKLHDKALDDSESKLNILNSAKTAYESMISVPNIPELDLIDVTRLNILSKILECCNTISAIPNLAELPKLDSTRLDLLTQIKGAMTNIGTIPDLPELTLLDTKKLDLLSKISDKINEYNAICEEIQEDDRILESFNESSKELMTIMSEFGSKYVRCANCGALVEVGSGHID